MTGRVAAWRSFSVATLMVLMACGETATSPSASVPIDAWTAPRTVAPLPSYSLAIPRMAGQGNTVAVIWELTSTPADESVQVSPLGASGVWEPPRRIGPAYVSSPVIGVDRAGRMVAAWEGPDPDPMPTRSRQCLWAATADPTGAWTAAAPLACDVVDVRLAVGPGGDAVVVWSSVVPADASSGFSRWSLWSARRAPDQPWTDLRNVTLDAGSDTSFAVAMDDDGLAAVAWDVGTGRNDDAAIYLATGRAGTPWAVTLLSPFAPGQRNTRVAFEAPGIPVVAWLGVGGGVRALRAAPAHSVTDLSRSLWDTCVSVAGSGAGASTVAWWRNDTASVWAASGGGGRWEPQQLRGAVSQGQNCPRVAMDAAGNAVIAWQEQGSGRAGEVWASARRGAAGPWTVARLLDSEGADPAVSITNRVAYVVWRSGHYTLPSGVALVESRLRLAP